MFYNFNDFNNETGTSNNNKRPVTSGATNGIRTQNNFYKPKPLIEEEAKLSSVVVAPGKENIHDQAHYTGDRVPTRERQNRSAHHNARRRENKV